MAAALARTLEFTSDEWAALGVQGLHKGSYVRNVEGIYCAPELPPSPGFAAYRRVHQVRQGGRAGGREGGGELKGGRQGGREQVSRQVQVSKLSKSRHTDAVRVCGRPAGFVLTKSLACSHRVHQIIASKSEDGKWEGMPWRSGK